jgi:hypothetical protein
MADLYTPIDYLRDAATAPRNPDQERDDKPQWLPSNPVYARVGDTVLRAARYGVQRNLNAQDIMREIREEHQVHLTLGELHLLLASRRVAASHTVNSDKE